MSGMATENCRIFSDVTTGTNVLVLIHFHTL